MRFASKIKGTDGQNPFSDSQARNFSDQKVFREFYPISLFWTLFNDQHEVLLGARGSGKTFLLKMMRYSMLKRINDDKAKTLVREKRFIAVYVPMHLEFVLPFNNKKLTEEKMIALFQIAFNCYLSESLLTELNSMIDEIEEEKEKIQAQIELVRGLEELWFGEKSGINDFDSLTNRIRKVYYAIDWDNALLESVPAVFKRQICSPLVSAQRIIVKSLKLDAEPTWIVCVDEAEFLNDTLQRCINGIFRSDSNRIALKIATLPFYHSTLETLEKEIVVSDGNDFNYTIVDMQYDGADFVGLTNSLCKHRLEERFSNTDICETVEDFVGVEGKDDYIDYYRREVGKEKATQEVIKEEIISAFADKRKNGAKKYSNDRKTIFDKFAPIFYLREMKKLSGMGNHKPGWFAGAKMIRRVSQGNPRLFIQVMSELFEKAKSTELTAKAQHEVIYDFAGNICSSTKALEVNGPRAYKNLDIIATRLSNKVHGEYLVTGGNTFTIKYSGENNFCEEIDWIKLAIAYSRVIVDERIKRTGITPDTRYSLSNAYAIKYWIPMRSDNAMSITLDDNIDNEYKVESRKKKKTSTEDNYHQLTLFEVNNEENK